MPREFRAMLFLSALAWCASVAGAQATRPDALARAAKSVAAIEFKTGPKPTDIHVRTAFCVDPAGLFLTAAPGEFNENNPQHAARVVLDPGGASRALSAKALPARYPGRVRLFLATGAVNVAPLEIARDAKWATNMPVTIAASHALPAPATGAGPIRTMDYSLVHVPNGPWKLQPIGADPLPASGLGAPLIGGDGRVMGMANEGHVSAPAEILGVLSAYQIEFDPPDILYARRTDKREFVIRVHPFAAAADKLSVELATGSLQRGLQTFLATAAGGNTWKVSAPPIDTDKDTSHAPDYCVRVKLEDKVIAQLPGTFDIEGAPMLRNAKPTTLPLSLAPPGFEGDSRDLHPPSPMSALSIGGGGRFMIAHVQWFGRLAVLDVCAGSIVKYLSLPPGRALFAASGSKLLLVLPEKNQVQRWDLLTFEREQVAPIPRNLDVHAVATGSAVDAQAMLIVSTREQRPQFSYMLLDLMKLIEVPLPQPNGPPWPPPTAHTRLVASSDGRVFTTFARTDTTTSCRVLDVSARPPTSGALTDHHLYPSADGGLLLGAATAYGHDFKPLQRIVSGHFTPVSSSAYYLQIEPAKVTFYLAADRKAVASADFPQASYTHFVPGAKVMVLYWGHVFALRRFDLDVQLNKTGQDYFFIDSLPPRYVRKGQKYAYQASARSKAGAFRFALESGPKGMMISDAGLVDWTAPPFASLVPVTIGVTDAGNRTIKQSFSITVR